MLQHELENEVKYAVAFDEPFCASNQLLRSSNLNEEKRKKKRNSRKLQSGKRSTVV